MNDLVITQSNLPNTLEDLSKFVLVGREKLTAVRAYIKTINKLDVAKEVKEQKLKEAQMLAELVADADKRMGELTMQLPKANGQRSDLTSSSCEEEVTKETKQDAIARLGFNKNQVSQFEKMARNPELVEEAKADAREKGEILTRSKIINFIDNKKKQEELQEQNYETFCDYLDECHKASKKLFNATHPITEFEISDEFMDKATELFQNDDDWNREIMSVQFAIQQMNIVLNYLIKKPRKKGVKKL